jgi:hypothetical protein
MDHAIGAAAKVRKLPILIAQRAAPFGQGLETEFRP